MTIEQLKKLKETEDKVEFKEAKGGNFSYNGGSRIDPKERRRCILGYVTAFANENGGYLVLGMNDKYPHKVVGTIQCAGAVGKLEQDIYRDTKIRVNAFELFDENKLRILVIEISGRPSGKVYKFEDVPLMRVGEGLHPMSDEQYRQIINEHEPDFSEVICKGITIDDLDNTAINNLKTAYAEKQENPHFRSLGNVQALSDVGLLKSGKVTYAALILLGKPEIIQKHIPQSAVQLEYRNSITQINFDNRITFSKPYFISIEEIWQAINQRNGKVPVQQGPYIFDIPFFNKEVIREVINNAIAHRDYRKNSEIVIKQFPNELHVINPGGFPVGVNLTNLLTVNSTPRNRLLADVLAKTGIVERSGQGIDKIFYQCISEAKPEPDYYHSDDFQVEVRLSGIVEDKAFALFIKHIQNVRNDVDMLSVHDIITLNSIRKGINRKLLNGVSVSKLLSEGLIEKIGKTNSQRYMLSKEYYSFIDKKASYSVTKPMDDSQISFLILRHLQSFGKAKMQDFVQLLGAYLSRDQIRYKVSLLTKQGVLNLTGQGKAAEYIPGKQMEEALRLIMRAMKLGVEEMQKRGELPPGEFPINPL